jgi:hypothetical protein
VNLKADHRVDEDGKHHVFLDGLRVWVHLSGGQWIAQGIDIDYATSGASQELAAQSFMLGLCMTIVEHVRRFRSLERLISKRAPDDVYRAWVRELETHNLAARQVDLPGACVPEDDESSLALLPNVFRFYESPARPS